MDKDSIHNDRPIVTRKEAIARGLNRYFTGKPCPKGHLSERMVCDWKCVQCRIEYRRERVAADPAIYAKNREYRKSRYRNDPEWREFRLAEAAAHRASRVAENREYFKKHYRENKERISRQNREQRAKRLSCPDARAAERKRSALSKKKHPESTRASAQNRRAMLRGAEGRYNKSDVVKILKAQGGVCTYCKADLSNGYHVDHMTPISRGGSNWPSNLQCLCAPCNLSKWTKTHEEYLEHLKKKPPE